MCYWDVLELEEGYLEKRFAFIAVSGNKTETVPESVGDGADQHLSEVEGKLSGSTRPSEGSGLVSQVCLLRYHDRGRLRNWGHYHNTVVVCGSLLYIRQLKGFVAIRSMLMPSITSPLAL